MLNNRELAEAVAWSVRTLDGYLYGGTYINGTVSGLAQEMWSCVGESFYPSLKDVDKNEDLLAAAPVGAVVGLESRGEGIAVSETWQKERNGEWAKTECWEERWGDWGRSEENHLTGEFRQFES